MIIIMINDYRTSADSGFANTWSPYQCDSIAHRNQILRDGLPVTDYLIRHYDGREELPMSTCGLRVPTRQERREAQSQHMPPPPHVSEYTPR